MKKQTTTHMIIPSPLVDEAERRYEELTGIKKDMEKLVEDTTLYFNGKSAPKFRMRLLDYGSFCYQRAEDMKITVKNYKKRIAKFEEDKAKFQNDINKYQSVL